MIGVQNVKVASDGECFTNIGTISYFTLAYSLESRQVVLEKNQKRTYFEVVSFQVYAKLEIKVYKHGDIREDKQGTTTGYGNPR